MDDLPDPDTPVKIVILRLGMSSETFLRLFSRALRILMHQARTDPDIALVFAQLGVSRTREGLSTLLERRLVARGALDRFLARGPADLAQGHD